MANVGVDTAGTEGEEGIDIIGFFAQMEFPSLSSSSSSWEGICSSEVVVCEGRGTGYSDGTESGYCVTQKPMSDLISFISDKK